MALQGHTLIELKDIKTGDVRRIEDENMLTNALDYILNGNLCGHHNFPTDHPEMCFPIVRQLLGGIMLFPETISENAENIYPPTMPTAYGGSSTDAGEDTRMGTYNITESGEMPGGYKHVWDFATSQGNGNISCVCLTHRIAGNGLFNALANMYYCEGFSSTSYPASEDERNNENDKTTRLFGVSQVVDYDGYRPITVGYDGEAIRVLRWDIVTEGTGINSERNNVPPFTKYDELGSFVAEKVIGQTGEGNNIYAFTNNYYFEKLSDGKYHGYCHATNSSGDAVIYTMTIDPSNWTMVEGSFTIPGKQIFALSVRAGVNPNADLYNGGYDFYYKFYSAIRGNYLYVLSSNLTQIYKINLNNTNRVTALAIPFRLQGYFHMRYNPVSQFIDLYCANIQSDGKYRYGCILKDDTIAVGTRSSSYGYNNSSRYFTCEYGNTQYKEPLLGVAGEKRFSNGVCDYSEKHVFLGYIASINNIATFVKTAAQTMKITYTITETEDVTLASIIISDNPTKTLYVAGETLDLTGMKVIAIYSDGVRTDVTSDCLSAPAEGTQLLDTSLDEISVYYTENGITRYATIPITVYELLSIAVVKQPTKVSYYSDDLLNLSGTQIQAYFSDGTDANVTDDCVFTPANGSTLSAATHFVSVEYTRGLVKKIATIPITVTQVVLESIAVTESPKTSYTPGEQLDLSGMVITASYNSGKTANVTNNVTTVPADGTTLSTEGTQNVVITYSENGITKTTTIQIYVTEEVVLASIAVTAMPTKTEYVQDNTLDLTGIEVTATYTDGTTQGVTSSCVFDPQNGDSLDTVGTQIVTVGYTENGVTKTTSFNVTVTEKPAVEIVPFSTGTDAQIAAMAQALRDGVITVEDTGWAVGDTRSVSLSAKNSSNFGNHAAQTQTLVILNIGGKTLANGDECSFVVGLKNMLANGTSGEGFGMNASNTNAGGWNACRVRTGCNEDFPDMLPEDLLPAFAEFKNITADGSGATTVESTDLFALASEKEIFGSTSYANATAEVGNSQFDYYKTSANRVKKWGDSGSSNAWWERSPLSGDSNHFCCVNSSGRALCNNAGSTSGLAPFGCF